MTDEKQIKDTLEQLSTFCSVSFWSTGYSGGVVVTDNQEVVEFEIRSTEDSWLETVHAFSDKAFKRFQKHVIKKYFCKEIPSGKSEDVRLDITIKHNGQTKRIENNGMAFLFLGKKIKKIAKTWN